MPARRSRGRPPHPDVLTPAEWAVLDWVRHGLTRRAIAERRGTSLGGVKYHLANIAGKLGVTGMPALRAWPGVPATSPLMRRDRSNHEEHASMTMSDLALGHLGQVALIVRDVARAETFYGSTLGLAHLFTFGDLAFFDMDGTRLYLQRKDDAEWRPGSLLYFVVDDIHRAVAELGGRGVTFRGAPHRIHTHDDGTEEWMAFFDDPDGNQLALMSRVAPGS